MGTIAKSDQSQQLEALFKLIERLVTEGDGWVKEAVVVGLLEDLQNQNIVGQSPESFADYLGPESKKYWKSLNEFWANSTKQKKD